MTSVDQQARYKAASEALARGQGPETDFLIKDGIMWDVRGPTAIPYLDKNGNPLWGEALDEAMRK